SMFIPQALKVLRVPSSGVSVATWWLAVVTAVFWTLYGVMLGKLVLIVPNVVMMPVAGIILWQSGRTLTTESEGPTAGRCPSGPAPGQPNRMRTCATWDAWHTASARDGITRQRTSALVSAVTQYRPRGRVGNVQVSDESNRPLPCWRFGSSGPCKNRVYRPF